MGGAGATGTHIWSPQSWRPWGEAFLLSLKDENGLTRSEPPKYGARRSGSSSSF